MINGEFGQRPPIIVRAADYRQALWKIGIQNRQQNRTNSARLPMGAVASQRALGPLSKQEMTDVGAVDAEQGGRPS